MKGVLYIRKGKLVNRLISKGRGEPCKPGQSAERTGCIPKKKPVPGQKRTAKLDAQQQVLSVLGKAGKGEGVTKEEAQHLADNIDKLTKDQVKTALAAYQGKKGLWKLAKAALVSETLKQFKDKVGGGDPTIEGGNISDKEKPVSVGGSKKSAEDLSMDWQSTDYEKTRKSLEDWSSGGKSDKWDEAYQYTQSELEKQGIKSANLSHGFALTPDDPLYKAILSGEVKIGDEIDLPEHRENMTWSDTPDYAEKYALIASKGTGLGIVISSVIDVGDIVISHKTTDALGMMGPENIVKGKHKVKITGLLGRPAKDAGILVNPPPIENVWSSQSKTKEPETQPEPQQTPKSETAQKFEGFEDGFSKGKPGEVPVPLAFPVYKTIAEMKDIRDKIPAFLDSVKDIKSVEELQKENKAENQARSQKIEGLTAEKRKLKKGTAAYRKLDNQITELMNEQSVRYNEQYKALTNLEQNKKILREKLAETFGAENPLETEVKWNKSPGSAQKAVFRSGLNFVNRMVDSSVMTKKDVNVFPEAGRACFDNSSNTVMGSIGEGREATAVHELGHWLEYNIPGAQDAAWEFVKYRCGGEDPKSMNEIVGAQIYGEDEVGRQNEFKAVMESDRRAAYAGKIYNDGATEIVSMGLEELYKDPAHFAKTDPEYFTFMMGVVQGRFKDVKTPKEEAVDVIEVEDENKPVDIIPTKVLSSQEARKVFNKLPQIDDEGYPSDKYTGIVHTDNFFKKTSRSEMSGPVVVMNLLWKKTGSLEESDFVKQNSKVKEIKISDLKSTQEGIEEDKVASLLDDPARLKKQDENDLPVVVKLGKHLYAWDGQHRVVAHKLTGADFIKARFVDLNKRPDVADLVKHVLQDQGN